MKPICAIATASGIGGIAIIRISGENSIKLLNTIFKGHDLTLVESHTINYGFIIENSNKIDEVLVTVMHGPKTFTGEDVVEINCHGGIYITNYILKMCLKLPDVTLAQPGEFSKRSFLNNKKSLNDSLAINDLINAKNKYSHQIATKHLNSDALSQITEIKDELIAIISQIEVNIDYPEYTDIEVFTTEVILPKIKVISTKISQAIVSSNKGQLFKNGISTVIIGAPNVGKSSLLNVMSNSNKAIVTDIEGTTRDIIETNINLENIQLNLIDTAGIRQTDDIVESIGVQRSIEALHNSQLILFVLDSSRVMSESELELYDKIKKFDHLVLLNKSDKKSVINKKIFNKYLEISTVSMYNINNIESKIIEIFDLQTFDLDKECIVSNIHQIALLEQVKSIYENTIVDLNNDLPIDLIEIDLKESLFILSEILGLDAKTNLIDDLFSRFCLGK